MPEWNEARVANGGKSKIIWPCSPFVDHKQWPQLTLSSLNGVKGMRTVHYGKMNIFFSHLFIYLFLTDHFYHILTIL